MDTITSRQNPLVASFRRVASGGVEASAMLLDGAHLIGEALAAGINIHTAAFSSAMLERADGEGLAGALEAQGARVVSVSAQVLDAMSPVRTASGVVALADRPAFARADSTQALEALFQSKHPFVLAADTVQDPGNVGAIIRAAEAGGATGVAVCGPSADPFGWKALRGSMGSALRLPVLAAWDPAPLLDAARAAGLRLIAAVPRGGNELFNVDLTRPTLCIVGAEGAGVATALAASADETLSIPMRAPVESLNVAVAAALIVYEARRQRERRESTPHV